MTKKNEFKQLGRKVSTYQGLETFKAPEHLDRVSCITVEVTTLCPVTGQPDWYTVKIHYIPNKWCVESKSLKLYLQSFRNQGHFCEDFSQIIAHHLDQVLRPEEVVVTVIQKPRGGISIEATSSIGEMI